MERGRERYGGRRERCRGLERVNGRVREREREKDRKRAKGRAAHYAN